jgi:hypothetical protein
MNNKFGRDGRYREDRFRSDQDYRRDREAREPFWRGIDEDRGLRSPDQEFETSGPYRQPREPYGQVWSGREDRYGDGTRSSYERGRYESYVPSRWTEERRGGFAGRGPKGYVRTDDRIREDVCDRLSWHDEVDATEISVSVSSGEVTLEGSVETRHMKRLAEDIAEDVPGVNDVHNRVRVRKPILTELKEKITGDDAGGHYANTGTKTTGASTSQNGRV